MNKSERKAKDKKLRKERCQERIELESGARKSATASAESRYSSRSLSIDSELLDYLGHNKPERKFKKRRFKKKRKKNSPCTITRLAKEAERLEKKRLNKQF